MPSETATFVGASSEATRHLELDQRRADVLAIGSQLAYGRVGLNASLPVYQAQGLRAAAIPTTILSVLPHYPSVHQTQLPAEWISSTLDDLTRSGALAHLRAVTVGYLATTAQVQAVAHWSQRDDQADVPLIVDPTFGDIGLGFYNDPRIVSPIREILLPLATGLTPNVFELAHLVGGNPSDCGDLTATEAAARQLLAAGLEWIVVTGIRAAAGPGHVAGGAIGELVVTAESAELFWHPRSEQTPTGVGDTFTASLTSSLIRGMPLAAATQTAAEETARQMNDGHSAHRSPR